MIMAKGMDKEYATIAGIPDFCKVAAELAFGENSSVLKDGRVCLLQIYFLITDFQNHFVKSTKGSTKSSSAKVVLIETCLSAKPGQ